MAFRHGQRTTDLFMQQEIERDEGWFELERGVNGRT